MFLLTNRLIVKLKQDLEPVYIHIIYQALINLKCHNKFHEDIAKSLSSDEMLTFSDIVEIQTKKTKNAPENIFLDGKETSENRNDTESKYDSVKDFLRQLLVLRFQI